MDGSGPDSTDRHEEVTLSEASGGGDPPVRYLFPIDGDYSSEVLNIVCDLVADTDAELFMTSPVTDAEDLSPEMPDPEQEARQDVAQFVLEAKQQCHSNTPIRQVVQTGENREEILQDIIELYDISTLVTEDRPESGIHSLLEIEGHTDTAVARNCDTIVVTRIEQLESVDSILVPVARGPHSGMAIETGLSLARQHEATLELLHVYDPDDDAGRTDGEELIQTAVERVGDYEHVQTALKEADDISHAIIEYTGAFDITVIGAPREGLLQQFILGTIPEEVSVKGEGTVLTTHRGGAGESWLDRLV